MKKIDISQIVSPSSKQPFTANSLKFKQDYDAENYAALVKSLIISNIGSYSLTTPYVISGCVLSGTYNITAGEIFYGGNFYNVTALSSSVNPIRLILTKTYDATADPLTFTDGVAKNVHEIYTYVSTDITIGGILASSLNYFLTATVLSRLSTTVSVAQSITSNTYIDLTSVTLTTPNDGLTRNWLILYKCYSDQDSTPTDAYLDFRLVNGSASTTYDSTKSGKLFSAIGGQVLIPVNMQSIVMTGIAPNTIIKVQAKTNIASCTIYEQSFIMIQM